MIRLIDQKWPGVRSSVVARTRLIDEEIGGVMGTSTQVVVLGAGFDSRAWRLGCLDDVGHEFYRVARACVEPMGATL